MLALRLSDGIIFEEYKQRYGEEMPEKLLKKLKIFSNSGYILINQDRARLTPQGFLVSNAVIGELIEALH